MGFDLTGLMAARAGEGAELWSRYLNPQTAKVLHSVGLDRQWVRAQGPYLWDDSGARYLDWLAGFGVFGVGRNHPVVRQAVHDVLDADLADMVKMDTPLLAGLLGEALVKRAPWLDRVYLCNSGTEAVEAALKFARYATGRGRVLYCSHAYHGLTAGAMSVNGSKDFTAGFGPLLPATMVPLGDLAALRREVVKGDVAALIVEPVQGKGVHLAPPGYLAEAAELLHANGALLICDEVQCGLGRTGRFFGFEHDGVEPDLVTVAKTLSGGIAPVAATIGKEWIFAKVYSNMTRVLVHDTTYSHNNTAAAAGLAALSVIDEEDLIANAAGRGAELIAALQRAAERYDFIMDVRGRGLMIGVEFGRPRSLRHRARYAPMTLARKGLFTQMVVCDLFEHHRILTQTASDHADVLKLLPPMTTTTEDVEWFMSAFTAVMDAVSDSSKPVWHFAKGLATRALGRA
ncbi:MAG TPA: aspartate aminotransferase family protein [Acidimicrobiales bacterium]|nr:aspartate aminotransferase family protein [Acidimicrobiales bacterium]